MPKLDGLKEDLGYFKFCFGIVVATFMALVGWVATNYNKAEFMAHYRRSRYCHNFCHIGDYYQ